jgi:hypothetical protein
MPSRVRVDSHHKTPLLRYRPILVESDDLHHPQSAMSASTTDEFARLWADALEKYKKQTGVDPLRVEVARRIQDCNSTDAVVVVLDDEMLKFKDFRAEDSRWGRLRNQYIKPVIDVVLGINDAAAGAASTLVRCGFSRTSLSVPLITTSVRSWRESCCCCIWSPSAGKSFVVPINQVEHRLTLILLNPGHEGGQRALRCSSGALRTA